MSTTDINNIQYHFEKIKFDNNTIASHENNHSMIINENHDHDVRDPSDHHDDDDHDNNEQYEDVLWLTGC
jgi:hypothetical protein